MIIFPGMSSVSHVQLDVKALRNYTEVGFKFKCDICKDHLTASVYSESEETEKVICSHCSCATFTSY